MERVRRGLLLIFWETEELWRSKGRGRPSLSDWMLSSYRGCSLIPLNELSMVLLIEQVYSSDWLRIYWHSCLRQ